MRTIKGYLIRPKTKLIKLIEAEITDHGDPFFTLERVFGDLEYEEKSNESILYDNNILFTEKDCINRAYLEYQQWQKEKNEEAHLSEEDIKKQKEENEKKNFYFGNLEYRVPGFCWRGQEPIDMLFGDAVIFTRNSLDQYVNSPLDMDDMEDLIEFKEFTASEIEYKISKGFNLISW